MLIYLTLLIAGYILGSLSSAIIVSKLAHLGDPRNYGSGNPGATNILRIGGKRLAAIVLLGDTLKGFFPVWVTGYMSDYPWIISGVGLAAFLGHLYPVFFNFRGGKGVATGLGVLLGFNWLLGILVLAVWLFVFGYKKISSLSALSAAIAAPFLAWWLISVPAICIVTTIMALLSLWRHRSNIARILNRREDGF
ncbi:glycerol-3-phosphate 1-O-acyltransferase PlsY [Candidatus Nitrosacidococcus sp. I8]|uniref:glycerol-3-phosphate 1-O-acyltransferase PlsY n=1 Tax=Candidatus Nitrosacidococcus sp. I8 TaxID=2942908 RepID=UPI002225D2F5|nr:glycerol-3-phosphate 1-O-acyltransferase PlsY [Candidatus Nitrosacidococcus sp. I8]CAH9014140.1 putative glycerol-3-phosphate acyltransferase [Candidatus Nitrosacidococcus sp. I8]